MLTKAKPAALGTRRASSRVSGGTGKRSEHSRNPSPQQVDDAHVRAIFANSKSNPAAIVAELKGIDTAICAGKVTVSPTPVFDLCRELITEGFPPEMPLVAYRDGKLAFSIRSIGEAAKLEIGARGNAFIRRGERRIASLVRKNGQADIKGQGANGRISGAVRQ